MTADCNSAAPGSEASRASTLTGHGSESNALVATSTSGLDPLWVLGRDDLGDVAAVAVADEHRLLEPEGVEQIDDGAGQTGQGRDRRPGQRGTVRPEGQIGCDAADLVTEPASRPSTTWRQTSPLATRPCNSTTGLPLPCSRTPTGPQGSGTIRRELSVFICSVLSPRALRTNQYRLYANTSSR